MISLPFNRFLHGVVYKEVHQIKTPLKVWNGKFVFKPSGLSLNSVKQLLKHLDLKYPRKEEKPLSITMCNNKQLTEHIEWITKLLAENGIVFKFVEEEWERLIKSVSN